MRCDIIKERFMKQIWFKLELFDYDCVHRSIDALLVIPYFLEKIRGVVADNV